MKYLLYIILATIIFISGCSNLLQDSESEKQKKIISFINDDVQKVDEYQQTAAQILNTVIISEQDKEIAHQTLQEEAIPQAEKAVDVVNELEIEITELEKPYNLLKTAMNEYVEALKLFTQGISNEDVEQQKKADEKFFTYEETIESYHEAIEKVANQFDVEYERDSTEDISLEDDSVEQTEEQTAILTFINEDVAATSENQSIAFDELAQVTGENYTDDETVYRTLEEKIIPAYEQVVATSKAIEPQIEALEVPKEMLVEATELCLDSFQLRLEAIEKQDMEMMEEADATYNKYYERIEEYHEEVKTIANQHDIDYTPDTF